MHERAEERVRERAHVARVLVAQRGGDLRGGLRGQRAAGQAVGATKPAGRSRVPIPGSVVAVAASRSAPALGSASASRATTGSKRFMYPTCTTRPAARAWATMPSASAGERHSGFSTSTCSPRSSASRTACVRARRWASTRAARRAACGPAATGGPRRSRGSGCRRASVARTTGSGSARARTAKRSSSARNAGRCASWAIRTAADDPEPDGGIEHEVIDHWSSALVNGTDPSGSGGGQVSADMSADRRSSKSLENDVKR